MNGIESAIISRHRLPQPYRFLLVTLWLLPVFLLVAVLVAGNGMTIALFDPRLLLLLGLMALPAFYIWQEGLDICRQGIIRRSHVPRYYSYDSLQSWSLEQYLEPPVDVLTIRDEEKRVILSCHARHLTDFSGLLDALRSNLRKQDL